MVEINGGQIERLVWPTTRLSVAHAQAPEPAAADGAVTGGLPAGSDEGDAIAVPGTGLDKDIVLVHGI